jgi:hypothetical protein
LTEIHEGKYSKESFCDLKGEPEGLEFTLRGGRSQADQSLTETVGKHRKHHDLTRTTSQSQLLDEQLITSSPSACNKILLFFTWLFSFLVLFGQWLRIVPVPQKNKSQRNRSNSRHHHHHSPSLAPSHIVPHSSSSSSSSSQKMD